MGASNFYIHYHYQNYLRFGIEKSDGKKFGGVSAVYDFDTKRTEFINKITQASYTRMDSNFIAEYEKLFKLIVNPNLATPGSYEQKMFTLLKQSIEQGLNTQIKKGGVGSLNTQQAARKALNDMLDLKNKTLNQMKLSEDNAMHYASKVRTKINNLYQTAQAMIIDGQMQGLNMSKVIAAKTALESAMDDILNKNNLPSFASISKNGASIDKVLKKILPDNVKMVSHNEPIIAKLNELIDALMSPTTGATTGDIGEYVGAAAAFLLERGGMDVEQRVWRELSRALKTGNTSTLKITGADLENNASLTNLYNLGSYFNINTNKFQASLFDQGKMPANGNSQTKVDIKLKDTNDNNYNISVKNYNLSNNMFISLVGETPLTTLLNEEPEFAAHYLNIVNAHKDSEGKIVKLSTGKKDKNGKKPAASKFSGGGSYSQYRREANKTLKLYALLPAMGGFTGRGKADYILVNDNSNAYGGVKLISIYDVFASVVNNESYNKKISASINGQNIDRMTNKTLWSNQWSEQGADSRVAMLLAEVHGKKISISLSPDVFYYAMYNRSKWAK